MKFQIIEMLNKRGFENMLSPSILPVETYLPYVNKDSHNQIVKLTAPDGTVQALRYDSTIASICSSRKPVYENFYYDEPKYSYDFNSLKIVEEEQLGIEMIGDMDTIDQVVDITLEIAELSTGGKFHIDLGNTNIPKLLIQCFEELSQREAEILHCISRKNKKYLSSILDELGIDEGIRDLFFGLLELNGPFKSIREKFKIIGFPQSVATEFEKLSVVYASIPSKYSKHVYCDLSFSDRLKYYDGFVFKVYSTKTHKEIISGGSYSFPEFGVRGIGFSLKV